MVGVATAAEASREKRGVGISNAQISIANSTYHDCSGRGDSFVVLVPVDACPRREPPPHTPTRPRKQKLRRTLLRSDSSPLTNASRFSSARVPNQRSPVAKRRPRYTCVLRPTTAPFDTRSRANVVNSRLRRAYVHCCANTTIINIDNMLLLSCLLSLAS